MMTTKTAQKQGQPTNPTTNKTPKPLKYWLITSQTFIEQFERKNESGDFDF